MFDLLKLFGGFTITDVATAIAFFVGICCGCFVLPATLVAASAVGASAAFKKSAAVALQCLFLLLLVTVVAAAVAVGDAMVNAGIADIAIVDNVAFCAFFTGVVIVAIVVVMLVVVAAVSADDLGRFQSPKRLQAFFHLH